MPVNVTGSAGLKNSRHNDTE